MENDQKQTTDAKESLELEDRMLVIDHYKQTPMLWDSRDPNYKRHDLRQASLEQLAEFLTQRRGSLATVEMVKRTWESLRRQYNRGVANEVRNEPNKWRLFPLMRFLDDKKPPWTWNAPAEPQERWMRSAQDFLDGEEDQGQYQQQVEDDEEMGEEDNVGVSVVAQQQPKNIVVSPQQKSIIKRAKCHTKIKTEIIKSRLRRHAQPTSSTVVVDHQAELLGFHNSSHPQHSNDTINGGEMNGSVFSGGAADNFLSTAQHDFAPFAQNVHHVYKGLHDAGRHADALLLKKKVNQLADHFEEMLYM